MPAAVAHFLWYFVVYPVIGIISLLTFLISCYALFIIKERRKYTHIPGPPHSNFFVGNGYVFNDAKIKKVGKDQIFIELARTYGPLVKIEAFHIIILLAATPEIARELLTKSKYPKAPFVNEQLKKVLQENFLGNSIVTIIDHKEWKIRRHALNPTFHRSFLNGLVPVFNEAADSMIDELSVKARSGEPVPLLEVFGRATLDAICKTAFSLDFTKDYSSLVTDLRLSSDAFTDVANNPILIHLDFRQRKKVRQYREALRRVNQAMADVLEQRLEQMRRNEDTPQDILAIMLEGLATHCSKEDLVSEMVTLLVAGQETTAAVLASLLMELGRQPEYKQRVREEVESVIGDKSSFDVEDLEQLPWITAVIKETLRLYPPAEGTTRELSEDTVLGGYKVFKGTSVFVCFTAIHYLHHEDHESFRPEKWLPEQEMRTAFNFMPFSIGQRSCIGRQFAWMEARILLAKFFQKFRYELDPSETFALKESLTMRPASSVVSRVFFAD